MIKKLNLKNFRSFTKASFDFSDKINIINAPNASGKTNILESIFLLSTGKSFKAKVEEEMINYDEEIARVDGQTDDTKLEVVLTRGFIDIGKNTPEKVAKKKLMVNGISRRMIDFSSNLKVTLFLPEDLDLVTSSPSIRRKFLDTVLSQTDRDYRRALMAYEKGVRQRNKILQKIRDEGLSRSPLQFWDQLLIKNGNYLTDKREEFVEYINSFKSEISNNYSVEYDRSVISEARLEQYKNEEVAACTTLVGPHRDDFIFKEAEKNLSSYGSRGEQRMAVLWIKLAELSFTEEKTSQKPTLLLDDIFSELDHMHRKVVMETINNHQVIITSADEHNLLDFDKFNLIKL